LTPVHDLIPQHWTFTQSARRAVSRLARALTLGVMLALSATSLLIAACGGSGGEPRQPPPARRASDPEQSQIRLASYHVRLAARNEIPPTRTGANGNAQLRINAAKDEMCWQISGLGEITDPLFAYLERGGARQNGPIVIPLGHTYRPAGCQTQLAPALLARIERHTADYYLNITTPQQPLGAARGQL
jgi:hypothetical protein